eukprot:m.919987 g.919987  ORF g.919987 m.919987 type:complete len:53 (-) comp60601_c0_seq1:1576-1734(-)
MRAHTRISLSLPLPEVLHVPAIPPDSALCAFSRFSSLPISVSMPCGLGSAGC